MSKALYSKLRVFAALLATGSGAAHIGALWFRELNAIAVISMLIGAVYLIIGIGLYGRSRFALFIAIVVALINIGLMKLHSSTAELNTFLTAGVVADAMIVLCCTLVLWHVRLQPSS